MTYAKAIANGIVAGLMAPIVVFALMAWAQIDRSAYGFDEMIPGTSMSRADAVLPVAVIIGFAIGFARTLWRARAKRTAPRL